MDQLPVPLPPRPTRARFEFAARAHREKIHSAVSDKACGNQCQEKNDFPDDFFLKTLLGRPLPVREDHVAGFLALPAAIFHVQRQIVFQNIVALRKPQLLGAPVNR